MSSKRIKSMSKNLHEEKKENPKNVETTNKSSSFAIYGALILLVCLGICISYDLHKTKQISSEILPQMQNEYETKIADLNAEFEILQREFNKLKAENLSVEALSEEYVDEKLAEFQKNVLNVVPQTEGGQILQNNAKIAELEKIVADMQNNEQVIPQEILLGAGALTIRSMADNGENFAYEAEVLQIMACGNSVAEEYIEKIRKFAQQPLNNKNSLIKDFKRIYADLRGTEIKTENSAENAEDTTSAETWKNAFFSRLKNLVTFKHKNTVKFEPLPDEVYELVNDGNLALALEKMKTSKKYASLNSPVLEAWVHNVQNYIEFDNAINGLLMNTLAHLHLKQFERQN